MRGVRAHPAVNPSTHIRPRTSLPGSRAAARVGAGEVFSSHKAESRRQAVPGDSCLAQGGSRGGG
eukprot:363630-Chlamydomonas_euryale.AAC.11